MASALPSLTPTQFANLAATLIQPACVCPPDARQWEGDMLFKVAFVLLFLWLLGMTGLYRMGEFLHALLLVGLMLMLMGFVKARDAVRRRIVDNPPDHR